MVGIRYAFKDHAELAAFFDKEADEFRAKADKLAASGNSYSIREQVAEYRGIATGYTGAAIICKNLLILSEDKT
jgi:hypothetical protein